MAEAWVTDEDLRSAGERFAAGIPGYLLPAAYAVARKDGDTLTFGHVNEPGAVRPLPAVVLASVCGYVASTVVVQLDHARLADVVDRLAPAEAATHLPHPNLWSWRDLLAGAGPDSSFLAYFLADPGDVPFDAGAEFRALVRRNPAGEPIRRAEPPLPAGRLRPGALRGRSRGPARPGRRRGPG
jgi:hypothetical protein